MGKNNNRETEQEELTKKIDKAIEGLIKEEGQEMMTKMDGFVTIYINNNISIIIN
jgi:hypothetical protein